MSFTTINSKPLLSLILLLFSLTSFGQSQREIDLLRRSPAQTSQSEYIDSARVINSEFDLIFGSLFRFYKYHISSQDASSCSFTPSCSEYALMAIKKQGIFIGLVNFWDRFSRCNGMSPEDYELDETNKLLIDPVRDWHYHEK